MNLKEILTERIVPIFITRILQVLFFIMIIALLLSLLFG